MLWGQGVFTIWQDLGLGEQEVPYFLPLYLDRVCNAAPLGAQLLGRGVVDPILRVELTAFVYGSALNDVAEDTISEEKVVSESFGRIKLILASRAAMWGFRRPPVAVLDVASRREKKSAGVHSRAGG